MVDRHGRPTGKDGRLSVSESHDRITTAPEAKMQRVIFSTLVLVWLAGSSATLRAQVDARRQRVSSVVTRGDTLTWIRSHSASSDSATHLDTLVFLRRGASAYVRAANAWVRLPSEMTRHIWRLDTLARDRESLYAKLSLSGVRVHP